MATESDATGRLLTEIAIDLASSLEPRVVIQRVLRRSLTHLRADRATLSSISADEVYLHATLGKEGDAQWIGQSYPAAMLADQPVVARAIDQAGPAVGAGLDPEAAAPVFRSALEGVRHTAAIPLKDGARIFGLLVLSRYDDLPFSDAQFPAMAAVGQGAALALRNAESYRQLESAREEAQQLSSRLAAAITAAEDIAAQGSVKDAILKLLQRSTEASGADSAAFAYLDAGAFVIEAATRPVEPGTRYPIPDEMRGILEAGTAVMVRPADYRAADAEVPDPDYTHIAIVPLLIAGSVAGIVILARLEDRAFGDSDVAAVQHFGTLGALLVENERLRRATLPSAGAAG